MGEDNVKIAILSGKGGTGKTFVSVNLAAISKQALYIDCDVEEPNGHLFLKPKKVQREDVSLKIPFVDRTVCSGCRKCVDFCKFNALAYIYNRVFVFEELCHSCGGCSLLCPEKAITEKDKKIGQIQSGISDHVKVVTGILNTGEASGVPIINKLFSYITSDDQMTLIDCPPGSACNVMDSIKDVDYCILVTEPTLFGVHNLNMVYELVKLFNKPHGVVLNKYIDENNPVDEFCKEKKVKILKKIPFDKEIGKINSNGLIAVKENRKFKALFNDLYRIITKEVN